MRARLPHEESSLTRIAKTRTAGGDIIEAKGRATYCGIAAALVRIIPIRWAADMGVNHLERELCASLADSIRKLRRDKHFPNKTGKGRVLVYGLET
jgi:hypothetical protein